MKFILEYPRWKRVKKQLKALGLVRLPDSYKGRWHNYSVPLAPPEYYPRIHIITTGGDSEDRVGYLRMLEVHVDIKRHEQTEHWHEGIDRIAKIIKNTI